MQRMKPPPPAVGSRREGGEIRTAGGQQHPLGGAAGHDPPGPGQVLGRRPAVPRPGRPRRPLQPEAGHARRRARLGGVPAHPGGKGVGGVDDHVDLLVDHMPHQPGHPPEATDAQPPGGTDGRAVRPASEVTTVRSGRPASRRASSAASVVPPRISRRRRRPTPGTLMPRCRPVLAIRTGIIPNGNREHRCKSGAVPQLSPGSRPHSAWSRLLEVGRPGRASIREPGHLYRPAATRETSV